MNSPSDVEPLQGSYLTETSVSSWLSSVNVHIKGTARIQVLNKLLAYSTGNFDNSWRDNPSREYLMKLLPPHWGFSWKGFTPRMFSI